MWDAARLHCVVSLTGEEWEPLQQAVGLAPLNLNCARYVVRCMLHVACCKKLHVTWPHACLLVVCSMRRACYLACNVAALLPSPFAWRILHRTCHAVGQRQRSRRVANLARPDRPRQSLTKSA